MDLVLLDLGFDDSLVDTLDSFLEQISVQFLESWSSDGCVEVDTLVESIDLDGGLSRGRKSSLSSFTGGP